MMDLRNTEVRALRATRGHRRRRRPRTAAVTRLSILSEEKKHRGR
jgi:hypothetical protein